MKKTVLASVLVLASSSVFADDFDYINGTATSSWEVTGSIGERCVVETYIPDTRTVDLKTTEPSETASVSLWCNTHSAKAQATYSSKNQGAMVNDDGDKINYTIDVDQAKGLDLASAQTVQQLSGHGTGVGKQTKTVWVSPKVSGREYAGVYRDTITVDVAAN